jgi:hypothetical protein
MPTFWDDLLIICLFLIPFLLIQIFFATRRRLLWGFVIPLLWTALGAWMVVNSYKKDSSNILELIFFYLTGDLLLTGILILFRYLKRRKAKIT